jgi:hypothetical protein
MFKPSRFLKPGRFSFVFYDRLIPYSSIPEPLIQIIMPAKYLYHDNVKNALIKEGWRITHDPFYIKFGEPDFLQIDLAADKIIAAEKPGEKIAVEIKSFSNDSPMYDFHLALGQFLNYQMTLEENEPDRVLYLAVPLDTYQSF